MGTRIRTHGDILPTNFICEIYAHNGRRQFTNNELKNQSHSVLLLRIRNTQSPAEWNKEKIDVHCRVHKSQLFTKNYFFFWNFSLFIRTFIDGFVAGRHNDFFFLSIFFWRSGNKSVQTNTKKTNKLYSCVIMIIKPLLRSYHSIATNFYSEVYTYVLQCAKCVYITFTISLNRGAAKCQQQFHWVKRNK